MVKLIKKEASRLIGSLINKKFLLAGDTFMPEMHWRQPGTTHSTSEPEQYKKQRKNIKIQRNRRFTYIHQIKLDKFTKLVFSMTRLMEILNI